MTTITSNSSTSTSFTFSETSGTHHCRSDVSPHPALPRSFPPQVPVAQSPFVLTNEGADELTEGLDMFQIPQKTSQFFNELGLFKNLKSLNSESNLQEVSISQNVSSGTHVGWNTALSTEMRKDLPGTRLQSYQIPYSPGSGSSRLVKQTKFSTSHNVSVDTTSRDDILEPRTSLSWSRREWELESTLLSYFGEDPLVAREDRISSAASNAEEVQGAPPLPLHFRSTTEVFCVATGIQKGQRYSPQATQMSVVPQSPKQLSARITLFLLRLKAFLSKSLKKPLPSSDFSGAVLWCLRQFGWQARRANLCPPASTSNLQDHHFWILCPPVGLIPSDEAECGEWRLIADFWFSELFRVARPTDTYAKVFHAMRPEFVGSLPSDLRETIETISKHVRWSLKENTLSIAPWRQASFLLSCYARGVECSLMEPPASVEEPCSMLKDAIVKFLHATNGFWSSLGFDFVGSMDGDDRFRWTSAQSFSFEKALRNDSQLTSPIVSALSVLLSSTAPLSSSPIPPDA